MELIDIIITTLSIVLFALLLILLLSFVIYKTRSKNNVFPSEDSYPEISNEITKRMREVVKPRKPQRYKVINENIGQSDSLTQNERLKTNGRYVVYNHLHVNEVTQHPRKKFTKWSD